MRDISTVLPDRADDLAADVLAPGAAVGEDPLRGGEHVHAEAPANRRDVLDAHVHAQARAAHAAYAGDDRPPLAIVAQVEPEDVSRLRLDDAQTLEVALLDQDAGELFLLPRPGHVDARLAGVVRIADAGQEIGDRVGHHGRGLPTRLREAGDLAP